MTSLAFLGPLVKGLASSGALKAVSTVATVGSGVIGAASAIQQGKAAKDNAAYMEEAGRKQIEAAERDSDRARRVAAQTKGKQAVALAANGIDVSSSGALDLLDDTTMLGEMDAFAIREGGVSQASGSARQAANYRSEASMAPSNAFGSILGTASTVSRRWDAWQDYEVEVA